MYELLLKEWVRFRHCDDGATLVEYGIAITLAVAVGTVLLGTLAVAINGNMEAAATAMTGTATP